MLLGRRYKGTAKKVIGSALWCSRPDCTVLARHPHHKIFFAYPLRAFALQCRDIGGCGVGGHAATAGKNYAALVFERSQDRGHAVMHILWRAVGHDVFRYVAHQHHGIAGQPAYLIETMIVGKIEDIHADFRQISGGNQSGGIVVQNSHRNVHAFKYLFKIWQGIFLKIYLAGKSDHVVENENPLDRIEIFFLIYEPVHGKVGNQRYQLVEFVRLGFHADEHFVVTDEKRCDVQRSAGNGEANPMTCVFYRAAIAPQPIGDKGQQSVGLAVWFCQIAHIIVVMQHFARPGKIVYRPYTLGPKGRRLGAHPVFRPETGQKHDLVEMPKRFEIRVQPLTVVGEIIQRRYAGPTGQPGTIDYQSGGDWVKQFAVDYSQQILPLFVYHEE